MEKLAGSVAHPTTEPQLRSDELGFLEALPLANERVATQPSGEGDDERTRDMGMAPV